MTSGSNGGTAALSLRGVHASYGDHVALEDVNADVAAGRVVGLIGPNGAGKTTLFKILVGLLAPDGGDVRVFGTRPRRRGRRTQVAYVPQSGDVDPAYPVSVLDVALMGRYGHVGWCRRPGAEDRRIAHEALTRVGIHDLAHRPFGALSGGQRQRVFLARALAQDARVFLLDEPFTGVDARTQEVVFDTLRDLRAEGRTLLVATHDLASVTAFCDDVLLVNRTVVAQGSVRETFTKGNLERTFGGRLVLLDDVAGGAEAVDAATPAHGVV